MGDQTWPEAGQRLQEPSGSQEGGKAPPRTRQFRLDHIGVWSIQGQRVKADGSVPGLGQAGLGKSFIFVGDTQALIKVDSWLCALVVLGDHMRCQGWNLVICILGRNPTAVLARKQLA